MVLYHDAVAILAAAVKRRNNKKWLRAEFELKSECISHDYPYPYPKLIDSPQMDHVRRARARRRMMKQKFNKIFGIPSKEPPISPPSSSPALASTSTATAYSQQPISVCGSCSSFMLWCSSCRARPSGHVLICLGLVHIVALQGGALAIFFAWTWFI